MEVLTLQFGHFSNHAGAHFWNFQDELAALQDAGGTGDEEDEGPDLDFARLHYETQRRGSLAWRPRLVLVDCKGALGSGVGEPADLEAAEKEAHGVLWQGGFETHQEDLVEAHPFQKDLALDDELAWNWTGQEEGADEYGAEDEEWDEEEEQQDAPIAPAEKPARPTAMRAAAEYNFSGTSRTWTDFLKVQLPDSSVRELQGWHHGVAPFALYFDGLEVRGREDEEATLDLVRRQLEECDQLDALHTVVDMHNGFGGVATTVLRWMHEEQPKCGKLIFALQPSLPSQEEAGDVEMVDAMDAPAVAARNVEACAWISSAFSFANILDVGTSAWVPMAVPLWSAKGPPALPGLDRASAYESSALIAGALETATMPYRMRGSLKPSQFLGGLAPSARPVCGLLQALPMPQPPPPATAADPGRHIVETFDDFAKSFYDLSALQPSRTNPYTSVVLRGADPRRLVQLCGSLPPPARKMSFAHPSPLPLPLPFPQRFGPDVSQRGAWQSLGSTAPAHVRAEGEDVEVCPVATQIHAAAGAAGRSTALKCMAAAAKAHMFSPWAAAVRQRYGLEVDDFREVKEVVVDQLECAGGSDSDDDDDADYSD